MQRMGSKEIILFLMVCFHFYYPASCLPLGKNLTSVGCNFNPARLQENSREKEGYKTSSRDGKIIAHRSNLASGAAGGRGGSSSRGGGGEEGNGGSSTPNTAAGMIPLYTAAGAANRHQNNHHGAASCNWIPALWAVTLASLVVHIYISNWK